MKVNKEEVFGLYVAREIMKRNGKYGKLICFIWRKAESVDGVKIKYYVPPIADHLATLKISGEVKTIKNSVSC